MGIFLVSNDHEISEIGSGVQQKQQIDLLSQNKQKMCKRRIETADSG
jgi:hypothetical protein